VRRIAFALAALLFTSAPVHALPRRLPPIEQCSGDRGFVNFRSALRVAVARRNRAALIGMLAPDVMVSFGGDSGRDAFAKLWSFNPKEYGNVWDQLETMLKLGCTNSDKIRMIPSLSSQLDQYGADEAFEMRLILPGARLFKTPGNVHTAAPVQAWSLAKATNAGGDLWTGVKLVDGREGFISDDNLYEPLGYRMLVEKRQGKWMITAFVAGD
jgi:hypothetical protein